MCLWAAAAVGLVTSQQGHLQPPAAPPAPVGEVTTRREAGTSSTKTAEGFGEESATGEVRPSLGPG